MKIIFPVSVIITVALLFGAIFKISRWLIFRDRNNISLQDMYSQSSLCGKLQYCRFEEIMILIGQCYRVRPEKLRLEDAFSGRLGKYDSWLLGGGVEDLEQCVKERFSLHIHSESPIETILELCSRISEKKV